MIISLGLELPQASSNLPEDLGRAGLSAELLRAWQASPYLVLLRTTLTVPVMSPPPRWALTPPFHPYLSRRNRPKSITPAIGGLFSVVLVSDRSAWTLSSVLALGVRTFLPSSKLDERTPVSPQRARKVYEPPERDSSVEPLGTNAAPAAHGWAPVASIGRSAWLRPSILPAVGFWCRGWDGST